VPSDRAVADTHYERLALAMMDDEQAEASLNRLINYEVEMRGEQAVASLERWKEGK
jgi:hypothetical protein